MTIDEFQKLYPTREEREKVLKTMSDNEIRNIINSISNVSGKIYYAKFLKQKKTK